MLRALSITLLLAVAFAGCLDESPAGPEPTASVPTPDPTPSAPTMTITGVVQDEDTTPVPGATVTLVELNRSQQTDAAGAFVFENVPVGFHVLRADATDFTAAEVTAKPAGDGESVSVLVVLQRFAEEPYSLTVGFEGFIQCAAEYLIMSPSCDTPVEFAGGPSITEDEYTFLHQLDPNWRTVVLDVDFDDAAHPGVDGLRVTVRGTNDADRVNEYEQYARFYGATNYRLEPGITYEDGDGPVPMNSTTFEYEVYPHSHAYHPAEAEFLGVGVATDLSFDLYATAFYVQGAPEGWSFLA